MKANINIAPLTVKGNTNADLANEIWYNKLNSVQRFEISNMFSSYKNTANRFRASINYIADNLEKF